MDVSITVHALQQEKLEERMNIQVQSLLLKDTLEPAISRDPRKPLQDTLKPNFKGCGPDLRAGKKERISLLNYD